MPRRVGNPQRPPHNTRDSAGFPARIAALAASPYIVWVVTLAPQRWYSRDKVEA